MTVLEQVARLYRQQPQPRTFAEDLAAHRATGYVLEAPGTLLLGREVPSQADEDELSDPWRGWPATECDAWFVWLAVGRLPDVIALIPHRQKWVAFARRGRIRWHEFDGLLTRIKP